MTTASFTLTRDLASKVLNTVDAGLCNGVGVPQPGQMCVEAAVCFAMGLPHGDNPPCVLPALREYKIRLNDSEWSSPKARAAGMRRLAIAQLGSTDMDATVFAQKLAEQTIRKVVPRALREAAKAVPSHAEALETAAVRCEQEGTEDAASSARYAASYAASSAASYAASSAASYAAGYAASSAASAVAAASSARDAASYAARYAAGYAAVSARSAARSAASYAASSAASYAASAVAASDAALMFAGEVCISVLEEMKAPAMQLVYELAPTPAQA